MTVDELQHMMQRLGDAGHGQAQVLLDIAMGDQVARLAAVDAVLVESQVRSVQVLCLRSYEERLAPKAYASSSITAAQRQLVS